MIESITTYKQGQYSDLDITDLMRDLEIDQITPSIREFKLAGRRMQDELVKRDLTDADVMKIAIQT